MLGVVRMKKGFRTKRKKEKILSEDDVIFEIENYL